MSATTYQPLMQETTGPVAGAAAVAGALEAEHDVLHEMWHDLRDATATADSAVLLARLEQLITFCGEHFEHEEESLIKYREIARKKHIAGHQALLDRLNSIKREHDSSTIANALADWWVGFKNHMRDYDRPALERLVAGASGKETAERIWKSPARTAPEPALPDTAAKPDG